MPAHRLVDVERVQARDVGARKPHVAYNNEFERVVGVNHPLLDRVALNFGSDVTGFAPLRRVYAQVSGHYHLYLRAPW